MFSENMDLGREINMVVDSFNFANNQMIITNTNTTLSPKTIEVSNYQMLSNIMSEMKKYKRNVVKTK